MPNPRADVPLAVRETLAAVGELEPMRRGSVSERWVKCSRSGCPCGEKREARHGPYFSLTRAVGGKTRSRFLSREEAEIVRRQIEAAHRFRQRLEAYWQACEQWADIQLDAATRTTGAEKGGSRRRSKRSSRRRPKRS